MGDTSFSPAGIRDLSDRITTPMMAAAREAREKAAQARVGLPKALSEQEGQINQLLERIPGAVSRLEEMGAGFAAKMHSSADAYEQTEQANMEQARRAQGSGA